MQEEFYNILREAKSKRLASFVINEKAKYILTSLINDIKFYFYKNYKEILSKIKLILMYSDYKRWYK